MQSQPVGWNNLPQEILVSVLLYLPPNDRFHASLVCQSWNRCFRLRYIWCAFNFRFINASSSRCVQAMEAIGSFINDVSVEIDQFEQENRENACKLLCGLAQLNERRIRSLKVKFVGENPILYAGKELLQALCELFGPVQEDVCIINKLTHVDLSGLDVTLDGRILDILSANNSALESINVQSGVFVCQIVPNDMLCLVQRCKRLKELCIFNTSLSDEVLLALCDKARQPLRRLSIACRAQDKYVKDTSSEAWSALKKALPNLILTLAFNHTCTVLKIADMLKPEIPVTELRLETYTDLGQEISQCSTMYKKTLEKVVIQCPVPKFSDDLDRALLQLSADCKRLRVLHVFCVLKEETVTRILAEHPDMSKNKTFTLKCSPDPQP